MSIGEFADSFDPTTRIEKKGSIYDRAMNMTLGVLVVNESQSVQMLTSCYEAGFPVALQVSDARVPRIETPSETITGSEAIQKFLAISKRTDKH
jgi:hypothetical protein